MKAVFFEKPGPPNVLKVINTEKPLFKNNEILIKVVAAGVNRPDLIQREGNYPAPDGHSKILGLEVSGIVDKIGKNVTIENSVILGSCSIGDNVQIKNSIICDETIIEDGTILNERIVRS